MFKYYSFALLTLLLCFTLQAQQPKKPTASDIYESIEKLNFLGSVLYVAAHPDDENTRLISYMANDVKARTAYLSLTRGDGGQNLVGPELRELLGLIRTQELLAARRIDGGEQLFTRANDFGYSKHPDETLDIWNKSDVLADVVWAIRTFQPDIIINRFDHRSPGSTHGHHTSSAMLSVEAFDMAGDQSVYPDQLRFTDIWQPKRQFFNTSWWFYGSQDKFNNADKTNLLSLEVGSYFPSMGLSNSEIAALSRSSHKSQGFGNTGTRGSETEYLELLKGELPNDKSNVFDGIDTSWNRVNGGKAIGILVEQIQKSYDFNNPSASLPQLMKAYKLIQNLEDQHWKTVKLQDLKTIISACAGLYLEVVAASSSATPGSTVTLELEAINRSNQKISMTSVALNDGTTIEKNSALDKNSSKTFEASYKVSNSEDYSSPYWLMEKGTLGMYKVDDQKRIGTPETKHKTTARFDLIIDGEPISFSRDIVYKITDPVKGEVYKPFEIVPAASAKVAEKVIIFESDQQRDVSILVTSGKDNLTGYVEIAHPMNWDVFPKKQSIDIAKRGETKELVFTIIPPKDQSEGIITPMVHVDSKVYSNELVVIDYDHIPEQRVLLPSETKIVRLDIKKKGENIGYIEGAGDVVPESLKQIGYNVTIINPSTINTERLSQFDAIVVGIRAYNTIDDLKYKQDVLMDYVKNGGTMIVQYNTSRELLTENLAPYRMTLSRDRVTDENSEVRILAPDHDLMNYPNKITTKDFEGWTQERGLYFPDSWSKEFTPILSMNDKGESPKDGSLLVASYGKGTYIYTGLSFFREFPEGVSGAYRLFANMLSIGEKTITTDKKLND